MPLFKSSYTSSTILWHKNYHMTHCQTLVGLFMSIILQLQHSLLQVTYVVWVVSFGNEYTQRHLSVVAIDETLFLLKLMESYQEWRVWWWPVSFFSFLSIIKERIIPAPLSIGLSMMTMHQMRTQECGLYSWNMMIANVLPFRSSTSIPLFGVPTYYPSMASCESLSASVISRL